MNFLKRLFGGTKAQLPPEPARGTAGDNLTANKSKETPTGSRAQLIAMIAEMTEADRGRVLESETEAANTIAASQKFAIDVVKELVTESFFSRLPAGVKKPNTMRSMSLKIGAAMGGPSFAEWLAEISSQEGRQQK